MIMDSPLSYLKNIFFFSLRCISFHTLGSAASLVEEHHEIDGHIRHLAFLIDFALVGNDSGCKDIVLRNFQKIVESTVFGVVLARLDFNRVGTHRGVVVNQIVHLALLAVVVIVELMPMCAKFLGYHILIDGTKIDTANIVENWTDVITIEYTSKQAHIVQIELQKVFLE